MNGKPSWLDGTCPIAIRMSPILLIASILAGATAVLARSPSIIFLHHSCGQNLIEQGLVRESLSELGYEFYDHGYNDDGLRLADGTYSGTNFDVPGDNTDPDGLAEIFSQPLHDPPDNTFSHLIQYDVIILKSCYPTSNITSEEQLAEYQAYYQTIRDRMDQHPEKTFIVVSQPPEVPGNSDRDAADRAREFVNWLGSGEFLSGHDNIFMFDFFDLLAGEDNFLRADYRFDDYDGHPNERANQEIGPIFVDFVNQAISEYNPGQPLATSEPATQPDQPATPDEERSPPLPESAAPDAASGVIDDFEIDRGAWEVNIDDLGSSLKCSIEPNKSHSGDASLLLVYSLVEGGYTGCGRAFESPQDWSSGVAVEIWLSTSTTGEALTFGLFSGDPENPTPFEAKVVISESDWTAHNLPWNSFVKAGWFGEAGLAELDPARITGFGYSLDSPDQVENSIWVDDISLLESSDVQPTKPEPPAPTGVEEAADREPQQEQAAQGEEDSQDSGGGLCPFSMLALPLGAACAYIVRKRHKH